MKNLIFILFASCFQATVLYAAQDHVLYYKGTVHWTDLTGKSEVPADQDIILKKEILPSMGRVVETAAMVNHLNKMCDATSQ
jgi:hypothetical protein